MRLSSFTFSKKSSLERRKGGGGGGKRGGSGGAKGGSSGSSSSGSKGGSSGGTSSSSRPVSVSGLPSSSRGASTYGSGGGKGITIPTGQIFSGRISGGGTRQQIFGSRTYGSGYPGLGSRTVAGRSFPFGFWPIVWGASAGGATAAYLHDSEYGHADNSSRPGGPLLQAPLQEPNDNTTYHLISDNTTITAVLQAIEANCTLLTNNITPMAFNPDNSSQPQPEQAIQYYRSSSIVLTLDGYNNTATDSPNNSTADTPLPNNLNTTFLNCLNQTIGASVPIVDAAATLHPMASAQLLVLGWLLVLFAKVAI